MDLLVGSGEVEGAILESGSKRNSRAVQTKRVSELNKEDKDIDEKAQYKQRHSKTWIDGGLKI